MSILDSIFGGGSQSVDPPGYIKVPSRDISRIVTKLIDNPNQLDFNGAQQTAINRIIGEATGGAGYSQGSENFLTGLFSGNGLNAPQSELASGLTGGQYTNPALAETMRVAFGGDVGSNPYLDASFGRAANAMGENFQDNVVADMDQGFASSGRLGSKAYAKARGSAEDAYGRQLNDLANEVYGGAYQFDQGRKDQALGQLGALGQQSVDNRIAGAGLYQQGIGNLFSGVGAMPGVDAGRYSDFDRLFQAGTTVQQQPWQSSRMGADILNSLQGGQTTSTDSNPWGQVAGLAATALGAYMASDRRLKQAVRRIGEMPSGLPLYRFRYVWGGPEQIGVMAQEAVQLFPNAVHEIDGWLVVDYGRIG